MFARFSECVVIFALVLCTFIEKHFDFAYDLLVPEKEVNSVNSITKNVVHN